MRVTVAHNKTKAEAIRAVDGVADDLFAQFPASGIQIVDLRKQWNGNLMHFGFSARWMLLQAPVRGTVLVSDHDVTIEVELPSFLAKLLPERKIAQQVESRVRGLLT